MAFQSKEKETEIIPRYNPIITTILAFAFTFALSLFIWWLFIDPEGEFFIWRTFRLFEEASADLVLNYIFLFILSIILYLQFIDPEMELKEFLKTKLKIRDEETGLALLILNIVIMFVIIAYITLVWGEINSLFNKIKDTSLFFISSTGIFIYLLWSFFWGHWPLNELNKYKIRVFEFLWCTFLLVLTYAWFVLPAQISNGEFKQVISLNAFVGYLYSSLAVILLLGILWENPHERIKNQPYQGILASSICLIGGYIFYAILALASTQSWFLWENPGGDWYLRNAANFSIFIISWIYFWAFYCGNWPHEYDKRFNIFMRTLLVFILALLSYYVYYIYLGGNILNESDHFYNKIPFIFQGLWLVILIAYNRFFERVGLWKKSFG